MDIPDNTRRRLLDSALKHFAERGYAGASVSDIVESAQVTKPTLYYYFKNKAELFQALIDHAQDERYRLMQEAAAKASNLRDQLIEILTAIFEFLTHNRELMRLAFSTSFAAPGELPENLNFQAKGERNLDFLHSLIKRELAAGGLNSSFNSFELAFGIQGLMSAYAVMHIKNSQNKLNRATAERIVDLYLCGAKPRP